MTEASGGVLGALASGPDAVVAVLGGLGGAELWLAIALATLVSEDLTCVAVGLLAARGAIGAVEGTAACVAGIVAGDLLLYGAGRTLGRAGLARWPLSRLFADDAVARAAAWLERRGLVVVLASRFLPGARLPTYLAAGLLRARALPFAASLLGAALLWTPAVVGAALLGARGPGASDGPTVPSFALAAVLLLLAVRALPALATARGRRLTYGRWQRIRRWEFWPASVLYAPIVAYVAWLAVKHRSLTLPTAANPGIEGGGFAGESKYDILRRLPAGEATPRAALVPARAAAAERRALVDTFLAQNRRGFPLVAKPDVGERGTGVAFPSSRDELERYLAASPGDVVLQEHVAGLEVGIFYCRLPDEARGRIYSLTAKLLPAVRGDGVRTLEELVLDDPRAVCLAERHLERLADRVDQVPPRGAEIRLVDVGTHSRGAVFLDAGFARTPALEAEVERLARGLPGFYFGRFDVRVPSLADLYAGRSLAVLELNGLTAEATHVYHPGTRLRDAYRVLFEQWRIAFEIGRQNRARGARPASLRELYRLLRRRAAYRVAPRVCRETAPGTAASHARAA